MTIGQKIKHYRKERGLTQDQFAIEVGVHFQSVSRWERDLSMPDIAQYDVITKTLNVTMEELFDLPYKSDANGDNFSQEKMGRGIKVLRTSNGLSQNAFASLFLSSSDSVSKWERGIIAPPIDTLIKISTHFNVSLSALYYGKIDNTYGAKYDNESNTTPPKRAIASKIFIAVASVCIALVTIASFIVFPLLNAPPSPNDNDNDTPYVSPIENGVIEHAHGDYYYNAMLNQYSENHLGVCILAGHCSVNVGIHNDDVIAFRIVLTHAKLTFNRLLGLAVAGISEICNCCFHRILLVRFFFRLSKTVLNYK